MTDNQSTNSPAGRCDKPNFHNRAPVGESRTDTDRDWARLYTDKVTEIAALQAEVERLRKWTGAAETALDEGVSAKIAAEAKAEALRKLVWFMAYPGAFDGRPTDEELRDRARQALAAGETNDA